MVRQYLASALPAHQVAEMSRLMEEEIRDVAIFFMDVKGTITVWNRAAEEMKGYTAEEAIGQPLAVLYTDEERDRGSARHNLAEAEKRGFFREEAWRRRKDGTLFWARIGITALRDASGNLVGFSKVTVDLTDHKRLEGCLKEREETRRILRTARAGTWTWWPERGEVQVAANFLELLGEPGAETTLDFERWIGFVDRPDRDRFRTRLEEARASAPRGGIAEEIRLCTAGGACRWFNVHADWYRESDASSWTLTGVNVDVDDLKTVERDLQRAVHKLQEADARKDEFLAMLAHELRNPLAPIRSAAEMLRMLKGGDDRVGRTSEIIARQVGHMTGLIDDLLDVSRVTRGVAQLVRTRLDLHGLVGAAVEQVAPLIEARQHRLGLLLAPQAVMVCGDGKRLVQVIANLLNNAAKYTPEEGHLELSTEVDGESLRLAVTDDGIGMEPAVAERVFELFAQAERTPDRSSGGLGLGLALVKNLVELHGGTVGCTSGGPGLGSRFTITLPLDRPDDDTAAGAQEGGDAAPAQLERTLRVMVVDDNVDAADTLALYLEMAGYDVLTAHGALSALERSRREAPDVFVLDIGLPEIDGIELARRLRAQPNTRDALLIALTGYGQEPVRRAAIEAGIDHHLVKPIDPQRLVTVLEAVRARTGP